MPPDRPADQKRSIHLSLSHFGVAYDAKVVLSEVSCQFTSGHVNLIYGAGGSGKSTLLKALAGWQRRIPGMRVWGSVHLNDQHTSPDQRVLVHQSLGFFVSNVGSNLVAALPNRSQLGPAEQRHCIEATLAPYACQDLIAHWEQPVSLLDTGERRLLSILVALLQQRPVLMLDEPTAGLDSGAVERFPAVLDRIAQDRLLIIATHDSGDMRRYRSPLAHSVGNRTADAPKEAIDLLDRAAKQAPAPLGIRRRAPSGFHWVFSREIAALSRPGLLADLEQDLQLLQQLGIDTLVCLEEEVYYPEAGLPEDMQLIHYPIRDMDIPSSLADTRTLISMMRDLRQSQSRQFGVHCRAGLGRTGTLLGCYVSEALGLDGAAALRYIREINPRFVQTEEQAEFIASYAATTAATD